MEGSQSLCQMVDSEKETQGPHRGDIYIRNSSEIYLRTYRVLGGTVTENRAILQLGVHSCFFLLFDLMIGDDSRNPV